MEIAGVKCRELDVIERKDLDGKLSDLERGLEKVFLDGWAKTKGHQRLSVREIWERLGRPSSIGYHNIVNAMERLSNVLVIDTRGRFVVSGPLLPMEAYYDAEGTFVGYEVLRPYRAGLCWDQCEPFREILGGQ